MTNETPIPPAVARLLALGPLPPKMSAAAAADILGGGPIQLEYIIRMVADGDMLSWSHSPAKGEPRRYKDDYTAETELPKIAPDTDPAIVLVDGDDVLWHFCLRLEEAIQGRALPPKQSVEARLESVKALQRAHAVGALPSASSAPAVETIAQRNDRWLAMFDEEKRTGPEVGAQTRAIDRIAAAEGVTKDTAKKAIQKAAKARAESYRAGGVTPIKSGKNTVSSVFDLAKPRGRTAR